MTGTKTYIPVLLGIVVLLSALYLLSTTRAHAEAPSGLYATVATTSVFTVNTTASLVFATTTGGGCAARTISTTASPIMIGFSDNQGFVPSALQGFLQAASTTVIYNGGLYGCGAVRVYSFVAGAITVMETR